MYFRLRKKAPSSIALQSISLLPYTSLIMVVESPGGFIALSQPVQPTGYYLQQYVSGRLSQATQKVSNNVVPVAFVVLLLPICSTEDLPPHSS